MISDSIPNASMPLASSNPKDFAKKKRANRSAKLKQCKLNARREQWVSQVKTKDGCKEDLNVEKATFGAPRGSEKKSMPIEKFEIKPRADEMYIDCLSMHHFSDSEFSPSNSPSSHASSVLGRNDRGGNFTPSSRCGSSSGRSSCFSRSMSDEDEVGIGDDGCLDDWEAMADALAASEEKQQEHIPNSGSRLSLEKHGNSVQFCLKSSINIWPSQGSDISGPKQECGGTPVPPVKCQAWRPDDAFRPQSLPNLSKQYGFHLSSERNFGPAASVWGCKNFGPGPTSCPICYEDFDCTDSSFIPCVCGFRLCLFCHKRILEDDGRCPGCRKQYKHESLEGEAALDGESLTFCLARSYSMITRS